MAIVWACDDVRMLVRKTRDRGETHCRNDCGDHAAPPGEEGRDTDEDLSEGEDERKHVADEHPPRDLVVGVDAALEVLWERVLHSSVLKVPNFERIEPEVTLSLGAIPVDLLAVLQVCCAVVPEPNLVDVAHVGGGSDLQLLERIWGHALGKVIEDIVGVVLE